jgi:cobalamin biosynthesis Mg chelatase CobN
MKYVLFLSLLLFSSCKTSKEVTTKAYSKSEKEDKEIVDTMKYLNSNRGYNSNTNSSYVSETETEEVEYENIVKPDSSIVSVPKKIKKTKTKTKKVTDSKEVSTESKSDSTKISVTKTSQKKEVTKTDVKSKSKMNNSPLVRGIYLIVALLVGGYIVVKKYFPSIFVKVTKSLKSIIK